MTLEQTQDLKTCLIIIGCSIGVLLLSFLIMMISGKKKRIAYTNDGDSPGDMFVGNGIGMRILGNFHRDFTHPVDRSEARKKKHDNKRSDTQDILNDAYSYMLYPNRVVGYEFFCFIVPLIPVGCYAYEIDLLSARSTRYRYYGSQKWYFDEVISIMLSGWAGVGIFGGIIGIISIFVF